MRKVLKMAIDSKRCDGGDLATLMRLFGPPPLLGNERLEDFEEMMNRFLTCMRPADFVVSGFVYQVGIETWCLMRWRRYQALIISRRERTFREFEAQRAKRKEQRKEEQEAPPELHKEAKDEGERNLALMGLRDKILTDCDTAVDSATETDLVSAVERSIDMLHKLEVLINGAAKRCNDALQQIEWYSVILAQQAQRVLDEIIMERSLDRNIAIDVAPLIPAKE